MRTLMFLIAGVLVSSPAIAGPGQDLAETAASLRLEAETRAAGFATIPGATVDPIETDDPFLVDVADFAAASARLSYDIEYGGGPQDLRCIFRGMAGDAEARISDLEAEHSGADLARIYLEYERLFAQASEIAPFADDPDVEEGRGVVPSCPAAALD